MYIYSYIFPKTKILPLVDIFYMPQVVGKYRGRIQMISVNVENASDSENSG